jgi:hypothetical protein
MKENPISHGSTESLPSPEDIFDRQVAIRLKEVASTHKDELLNESDWTNFNMGEFITTYPSPFDWSVYVKNHKDKNFIGVKIIGDKGLLDVREYFSDDPTLKPSTRQDEIEAIIDDRFQAADAIRKAEKAALASKQESLRGFAEGPYEAKVHFLGRNNAMRALTLSTIHVSTADTIDDVLSRVKGDVQMLGLHNYGANFGDSKSLPISVALKNAAGKEISFELVIDRNGWIVSK